jgi:hypothetical protein
MAGYNGWINGKPPMYVPVQPLLDYLDEYYPVQSLGKNHNEKRATILGCSIHTYRKMKYRKLLMWIKADEYAIRLGVHPVEIWSDWYDMTDPEKRDE